MRSIQENISFNREKEDNLDLESKLKKENFNTEQILYLGYDINMKVELMEDGTNRVLELEGVDISDKNISI